jgi:hypothetical protein
MTPKKMLYTYILNKEKVGEYFPETEVIKDDNSDDDLVCVNSNKWIDIPESDRYIPFSFKSNCAIPDERFQLIKKYIEKRTNKENIFFQKIDKLGTDICEYRAYVGDEILYITEADSYKLKDEISIFKDGDKFITDDENRGRLIEDEGVYEMGGIWFGNNQDRNIDFFSIANPEEGSMIMDFSLSEGKVFYKPSPFICRCLKDIEKKKLPSCKIEKNKWFSLIQLLLKEEDPIYTPVKIKEMLKCGRFCFQNHSSFIEMLQNSSSLDDLKIKVTDRPGELLLKLRLSNTPYIMVENDGIYEIIYHIENDHHPEADLNQILKENCKNHQELLENDQIDKLSLYIHDDYGLKIEKENMIYKNPYTENLLPSNIVHCHDTFLNGIDPPIENYDPHKKVKIEVPIEVEIKPIDETKVAIVISTHKEKECLYEGFHYPISPTSNEYIKAKIKKLWKKGYLLNDYGLTNLHHYNNYVCGCIEKPWWFQGENQKQGQDLIEFIDCL